MRVPSDSHPTPSGSYSFLRLQLVDFPTLRPSLTVSPSAQVSFRSVGTPVQNLQVFLSVLMAFPVLAWLLLAVATHTSVLAWRVTWMEEPGGLRPLGSQSRAQQHTHMLCSMFLLIIYFVYSSEYTSVPTSQFTLF